jgi:hypothetical protein
MQLDILYNEDCLEGMRKLPENCIDAVVTDPPYGISFMCRKWDYDIPSVAIWQEVCRVLKPGGHLLSFGSTRTYHRMLVNIEDAGFEPRDTVAWHYATGFPKNLDISRQLDKDAGANRSTGAREWSGGKRSGGIVKDEPAKTTARRIIYDTPATPEAKQWSGWGTALKPATELIALARKPLSEGTVAANVLKHGTGAINIDGCRIEHKTVAGGNLAQNPHLRSHINGGNGGNIIAHEENRRVITPNQSGRWPANAIFDEAAGEVLDEQSGITKSSGGPSGRLGGEGIYGDFQHRARAHEGGLGDIGGASRFFYCAKSSKRERGEDNNHPTVKPIKLMEYLVRLIAPPGGVVLDPFSGSGTTLIACQGLGYHYIGFEKDPAYFAIATKRVEPASLFSIA